MSLMPRHLVGRAAVSRQSAGVTSARAALWCRPIRGRPSVASSREAAASENHENEEFVVIDWAVIEADPPCAPAPYPHPPVHPPPAPCHHGHTPADEVADAWDYVGLNASVAEAYLLDATTYRMFVGSSPRTASVKSLKSYRDNVTRKLAPAIALGRRAFLIRNQLAMQALHTRNEHHALMIATTATTGNSGGGTAASDMVAADTAFGARQLPVYATARTTATAADDMATTASAATAPPPSLDRQRSQQSSESAQRQQVVAEAVESARVAAALESFEDGAQSASGSGGGGGAGGMRRRRGSRGSGRDLASAGRHHKYTVEAVELAAMAAGAAGPCAASVPV